VAEAEGALVLGEEVFRMVGFVEGEIVGKMLGSCDESRVGTVDGT
jgi:hypothetical protein